MFFSQMQPHALQWPSKAIVILSWNWLASRRSLASPCIKISRKPALCYRIFTNIAASIRYSVLWERCVDMSGYMFSLQERTMNELQRLSDDEYVYLLQAVQTKDILTIVSSLLSIHNLISEIKHQLAMSSSSIGRQETVSKPLLHKEWTIDQEVLWRRKVGNGFRFRLFSVLLISVQDHRSWSLIYRETYLVGWIKAGWPFCHHH